ncbi:MAG: hypothetical protein K2G29_07860 [Muribaculaceae bacterium]|nr:hypothetical protein [Muribaculaceae bacterium]
MLSGSFFQGEVYDSRKTDESNRTWRKTVKLDQEKTVSKSVGEWNEVKLRPSYGDRVLSSNSSWEVRMPARLHIQQLSNRL